MNDKITFIGPINNNFPPKDGETAKNQILHKYLLQNYNDVYLVDTFRWRRSIKVLVRLFYSLFLSKNKIIVISICTVSAYYLTKIIYFTGVKKKLYYFVIGNTIDKGLINQKFNSQFYKIYTKIFVEGKATKAILEKFKLQNVAYLPNFKDIPKSALAIEKKHLRNGDIINFVFLSRISKEKGVNLIFEATEFLNLKIGRDKLSVTFFGPIQEDYKNEFYLKVNEFSNTYYRGYLNLKTIDGYKKLSDYHVLLFPTFWEGEGFPGIVIDAFISGLPIIASDWNLNSEIIKNNETGFLISPHNSKELEERMLYFINHSNRIFDMGNNCRKEASCYDVKYLLDKIDLI